MATATTPPRERYRDDPSVLTVLKSPRLFTREATGQRDRAALLRAAFPRLFGFDERFGLRSDRKVIAGIREAFGERTFADAAVPLYITATDFRTGGIVHGPVVRDHGYSLNKKVRRLGLISALSQKAKDGKLVVLESTAAGAEASKTRALARKLGVTYEFLLMHASGDQLRQIAELVDSGAIRPVVGATFPFDQTVQALASLGTSSIRGKAVITGANQPA